MAAIEFIEKNMDQTINIKMSDDYSWKGSTRWQASKIDIIRKAQSILRGYSSRVTLRQLYYQMVARDFIPNHDKVYKKIGNIIADARLAGWIDWWAIIDRNRSSYKTRDWGSPNDALKSLLNSYNTDKCRTQPTHIELWTEKDAITGVVNPICAKYDVRLVVNKGHGSWSSFFESFERFKKILADGKKIKILYLGDHDPSGLHMIEDIEGRMKLMLSCNDAVYDDLNHLIWDKGHGLTDLGEDLFHMYNYDYETKGMLVYDHESDKHFLNFYRALVEEYFEVIPIGITLEQIERLNLPPNPAKISDPRAAGYIEKFGPQSWEVDALPLDELETLVEDSFQEHLDMDLWKKCLEEEQENKSELRSLIDFGDDDPEEDQ